MKTSDEYKRIWRRYNLESKMVNLGAEKMETELEKKQ